MGALSRSALAFCLRPPHAERRCTAAGTTPPREHAGESEEADLGEEAADAAGGRVGGGGGADFAAS